MVSFIILNRGYLNFQKIEKNFKWIKFEVFGPEFLVGLSPRDSDPESGWAIVDWTTQTVLVMIDGVETV